MSTSLYFLLIWALVKGDLILHIELDLIGQWKERERDFIGTRNMLLFSLKASKFDVTFTFHCLILSNVIVWESNFSSTEACHWNNDWGFLNCDFFMLVYLSRLMWIHHKSDTNLTSIWWFYIMIGYVLSDECVNVNVLLYNAFFSPFIYLRKHTHARTYTLVFIITKPFLCF